VRKFASVPPRVWQSDLRGVRGDLEALAAYFHLTTSGHATMLGLYYIPVPYLAHEIGCPIEGASKGLLSLIKAGLCSYDFDQDLVWVHEMAADQIAPQLMPKDKRVVGIADQLSMFPICPITLGFFGRYREPFHLFDERSLADFEHAFNNSEEAPSMPLRSKEKEKEQDKDLGKGTGQSGSGGKGNTRASIFEPLPIPASAAEGRAQLIELGVPLREMDSCLRKFLGGNLSMYEIEGLQTQKQGAA
jgi:hypothetical protein